MAVTRNSVARVRYIELIFHWKEKQAIEAARDLERMKAPRNLSNEAIKRISEKLPVNIEAGSS